MELSAGERAEQAASALRERFSTNLDKKPKKAFVTEEDYDALEKHYREREKYLLDAIAGLVNYSCHVRCKK